MKKIKALVTLVVSKGKEVPPGDFCEVSDDEAKRLITRGFATEIKKTSANPQTNHTQDTNKPQTKSEENNNDPTIQKSGGQPVS